MKAEEAKELPPSILVMVEREKDGKMSAYSARVVYVSDDGLFVVVQPEGWPPMVESCKNVFCNYLPRLKR